MYRCLLPRLCSVWCRFNYLSADLLCVIENIAKNRGFLRMSLIIGWGITEFIMFFIHVIRRTAYADLRV